VIGGVVAWNDVRRSYETTSTAPKKIKNVVVSSLTLPYFIVMNIYDDDVGQPFFVPWHRIMTMTILLTTAH